MQKKQNSFFTVLLLSAAFLISPTVFGWGGSYSSSYSTTDTSTADTNTTDTSTADTSTTDTSSSYGGGGSYSYNSGSGGWSEEKCRVCHTKYAAEGVLPLPRYNPDNHHKLVFTQIRHKTAPNWENENLLGDTDKYQCLTCHVFTQTEEGYITLKLERNCLNCHKLSTVTGGFMSNRHMRTVKTRSCSVCHCRMPSPGPKFGSCGEWGGGGW